MAQASRIGRRRLMAAGIGVLGAAALPRATRAETRQIAGNVTWRERMALPPMAQIDVMLIDVSRADAPAPRLAAQKIFGPATSPVPFLLDYDPALILDRHSYALRATIRFEGHLAYTSTRQIPAFPATPGPVEIPVEQIKRPHPSPAHAIPVGNWLAEDIMGGGVIDNLQSTLVIAADGHVSGSAGCNRFTGRADFAGNTVSFGALGSTRRACVPAAMDQETKFYHALSASRSFRQDPAADKLILLDAEGQPVMRLALLPG